MKKLYICIVNVKKMDEKLIQKIAACKLFREMSEKEIGLTMATTPFRTKCFDKGELYALAGSECRNVDIVLSGKMMAGMSGPSGKFVKVATLSRGDIIAPAYLFANDRSMPVTVMVEADATVVRIPLDSFKALVDQNEKLRWNFITLLSNFNGFLSHKLHNLSLLSVKEKIGKMLFDMAKRQGSNSFILNKSRQEIADEFGIQRYSVFRQLAEFQDQGAIKIEGKHITILDPKLLRNQG